MATTTKASKNAKKAEPDFELAEALMTRLAEAIEGLERVPNKSATYERIQVGGKTFGYIFPPRPSGIAVKIPKQLLHVEASLPNGHGFKPTIWGLVRTITKTSEVASVAKAFSAAAKAVAADPAPSEPSQAG